MNQNGLPGGGPWRILDECPAMSHNTGYAAQKGARRRGDKRDAPRHKCICPRALVRLSEIKTLRIEGRMARGERKLPEDHNPGGRPRDSGAPQYLRNTRPGARRRDLSAGLCRTPLGMFIMDEAAENRWAGESLAKAKEMCAGCPVNEDCLGWATDGERTPGAWTGMYGGLTHMERRDAAKKKGIKAA